MNHDIVEKEKTSAEGGGIIYNVTTKVDWSIAPQWLQWLKQEHIPALTRTGCFTHANILRLIEVDDTEGPTYAVQYHATSKANYNRYITSFAEEMRKQSLDKWGDRFIAFRSVLTVVD